MPKLVVVAIGGNSLIKDAKHQSVADQYQVAAETCRHLADLVEAGYDLVVTHGNGPQVGFGLIRSERCGSILGPVPLDSCVAETQGLIGYMLQQNLENEFRRRNLPKHAVSIVTEVGVDAEDAAFRRPTKPIGPFLSKEEAEKHALEDGWSIVEDSGRGFRRVVASPKPVSIVQHEAVRALIASGFVVIAVGGGGIPVVDENGALRGAAAVIDKDRAGAMLATFLGADLLVVSTAVPKVSLNYNKPDQVDLDVLTTDEAREYMCQGHFPAGSMGPKIEAAADFVERGGEAAIITSPDRIFEAAQGRAGTRILPGAEPDTHRRDQR